jgi:hypothetical protein
MEDYHFPAQLRWDSTLTNIIAKANMDVDKKILQRRDSAQHASSMSYYYANEAIKLAAVVVKSGITFASTKTIEGHANASRDYASIANKYLIELSQLNLYDFPTQQFVDFAFQSANIARVVLDDIRRRFNLV